LLPSPVQGQTLSSETMVPETQTRRRPSIGKIHKPGDGQPCGVPTEGSEESHESIDVDLLMQPSPPTQAKRPHSMEEQRSKPRYSSPPKTETPRTSSRDMHTRSGNVLLHIDVYYP